MNTNTGVGDIERIAVDDLYPDPANVRQHDDRNLEAIMASLRRFGQQKPIVVDSGGVVVAGNGTLAAARALGWREIDCVRTALSGPDAVAYAIADNRTAELAVWDDEALAALLQSLPDDATRLAAGWDDGALEALMASVEVPDFQPASIEDQGRLDEKSPVECPECGHHFVP